MIKRCSLCAIFFIGSLSWAHYPWMQYTKKSWAERTWFNKGSYFLGDVMYDALLLGRYILSVDSAKVITGFIPPYLATRWIDENVQSNFHDRAYHKNINQLPKMCHQTAQKGIAVPMVFLSSLSLWGWTESIRYTGRLTFLGLPFVHSGKDIIKQARFKSCLRPWHENFSKKERASGGFPSGHTANIVYMSTLWWLQEGPKWGVPLSLFGVFVMADFINCNRHYVSQIVAGAGLGVLVALAAHKVINRRLHERCELSCGVDRVGKPTLNVGFNF